MEAPVTVTFSEEDYRRLMLLTLLGEWVINAVRKDPDPAFLDTASRVYSFAKGTPLERLVGFDTDEGAWGPSEAFELEAQALIDEYDDTTFWEELTTRLTERDLIANFGERAVRGMRPNERVREASKIAKAYTQEFEDSGLDRLHITD
jgi:hypothetical protein